MKNQPTRPPKLDHGVALSLLPPVRTDEEELKARAQGEPLRYTALSAAQDAIDVVVDYVTSGTSDDEKMQHAKGLSNAELDLLQLKGQVVKQLKGLEISVARLKVELGLISERQKALNVLKRKIFFDIEEGMPRD